MAERKTRNITVPADVVPAIHACQDKLEKHLGFRPTIAQTIHWLIANAEKAPRTEAVP